MTARQIIVPGAMPSRDANGRSLPANLGFYAPGTGSTPKTVYTTSDLDVAHGFPIPSDSGGRFPQIWAEEDELFDVVWSRLDNAAFIAGFADISPLNDATLASVAEAEAFAEAAEEARDDVLALLGDSTALAEAVAEATAQADAAGASSTSAMGYASDASEALEAALAAQAAAEAARDEASEIADFDPGNYVSAVGAQTFTAGEQLQARQNIGAQPELGLVDRQKVARPAIASGVLTLDCAAASVFEIDWTANITSLVLSGLTAGTDSQSVTLILKANGGATYAFGAAFKPVGNAAPGLSTTVGDYNYLTLTTRNAGARVDYFFAGFTR